METNTYLLIIIALLILVIAFLLWVKKQTNDDFDELFDGLDVEFKGNEKNLPIALPLIFNSFLISNT